MTKLGDICEIVSGSTPKTNHEDYWNGQFCWVTPAEISDSENVIYDTERKITEKGAKSCSLTLMPVGTVLLSSRAPIGKVAITGVEMYCNQGFKNLICKNNVFNRYLYWFLKGKTEYLNSLGRGATFKEISKKIVSEIEVPLPKIEIQRQIAENLDKVTRLIDLCNTILEKLDLLVKARFVEMFGDMVLNPNGWEKTTLGTVCDVRDGTHDSPKYFAKGYPLVTSKNVTSGKIDFSDCNLICEEDLKKINERSKVDSGDILMPMIGTVGKPVIVDVDVIFAIKNVALIKFYENSKVQNVFIKSLLESDYFDTTVISKIRGGTQKFIALGDIRKLEICLPPIGFQNQFYDFVKQTEKSKISLKQVLEKAETLKKALMQKYFE